MNDNFKKQPDIDITESGTDGNFKRLDLIRRLSEIRSHYNCFSDKERKIYHTLSEAIEALQEPKTGKWNEYYRATTDDTFHCSPCGSCFIVLQGNDRMNFCPNCGARMGNSQ